MKPCAGLQNPPVLTAEISFRLRGAEIDRRVDGLAAHRPSQAAGQDQDPVKTIDSKTLPGLPREVKSLIRGGIYSLYTVKRGAAAAAYVLATNRGEFHLLSSAGEPTGPSFRSLDSIDLEDVVQFADFTPDESPLQNWI